MCCTPRKPSVRDSLRPKNQGLIARPIADSPPPRRPE